MKFEQNYTTSPLTKREKPKYAKQGKNITQYNYFRIELGLIETFD